MGSTQQHTEASRAGLVVLSTGQFVAHHYGPDSCPWIAEDENEKGAVLNIKAQSLPIYAEEAGAVVELVFAYFALTHTVAETLALLDSLRPVPAAQAVAA